MGDIKIFNIEQCKRLYNLKTFVETGTLYGDTIDYFKNSFNELHSIEIDKELAEKARNRFIQEKNIYIHSGKSVDILNDILPNITDNILFWLDAHFPGADAHKVSYDNEKNVDIRLPLETELNTILNIRKNNKDMIIIDDFWLYEEGPFEWGSFDQHMRSIGSTVTKKSIINKNSDFIYDLIKDRYNFKKDYHHQGYLIIYPKE